MKFLLDFNTKVGTEHILKPTIRSKSLHEISNDNGVRIENFIRLQVTKSVQSIVFAHRNTPIHTGTSDGKTTVRLATS